MSSRQQTRGDDKNSSLKQQSHKPSNKDSDLSASPQLRPATPLRRVQLAPRSPSASDVLQLQRAVGNRAVGQLLARTVGASDSQGRAARHEDGAQNRTGLPDKLKAGVESLSGLAMDDVRVFYNSSKPAEVRALAHTQGRDIYVGPGQEKHLPHEAWHVVQQKQGRVNPTAVQAKGASLNDDAGLEREADRMGALASHTSLSRPAARNVASPAAQPLQPEVVQRKKVPTGFGDFETKEFKDTDDAGGKGVDITLTFAPDPAKVDAKKIALSQSIRNTTPGGVDFTLGVTKDPRMVPSGKAGGGYAIDAPAASNNPIYYDPKNLGPKEELKDTPMAPPSHDPKDPTKTLTVANYELGYCYKDKPKDKDKKKHPAKLVDRPRTHKKGSSQTFETAAFAIEGADKDKYYGSVKWGYKLEGTDAAPKVTSTDITLASPAKGKKGVGTPTENFLEAAKLWNVGKAQGTLQVIADIRVRDVNTKQLVTLAKGTKVKQVAAGLSGETPIIIAEVLKADGTGTGVQVGLRNTDVEDMGDGPANKPLPLPAEKAPAKK